MSEDNNKCPVRGQSITPQRYCPPTNDESPTPRVPIRRATDTPQRKRPKYSRTKTGCMTCRFKKVKCDESKPICMRCTHGARECSWPEGTPTKKRTSSKKDSLDEKPSTSESVAESSGGLSESPSPSGREQTPPYLSLADLEPVSPHSCNSCESTYSMSPDYSVRSIYPQRSHSFPETSASHYTGRYYHTYVNPDPRTVPYGTGSATSLGQLHIPQANPMYWNSDLDTSYYHHRVSLQDNVPAGQASSPLDHPYYGFY